MYKYMMLLSIILIIFMGTCQVYSIYVCLYIYMYDVAVQHISHIAMGLCQWCCVYMCVYIYMVLLSSTLATMPCALATGVVYMSMFVYIYIYIYIYICVCVCVCVCMCEVAVQHISHYAMGTCQWCSVHVCVCVRIYTYDIVASTLATLPWYCILAIMLWGLLDMFDIKNKISFSLSSVDVMRFVQGYVMY